MTKQTQKATNYTLATHAIEHMKLSQEAVCLCKQIASGGILADRAVEQIKLKHGVKKEA